MPQVRSIILSDALEDSNNRNKTDNKKQQKLSQRQKLTANWARTGVGLQAKTMASARKLIKIAAKDEINRENKF